MSLLFDHKKESIINNLNQNLSRSNLSVLVKQLFKNLSSTVQEHAAIQDKDNATRKEEVLENFKNAWDFSFSNYSGGLNFDFLRELAGKVEPDLRLSPNDFYSLVKEFFDIGIVSKYDK